MIAWSVATALAGDPWAELHGDVKSFTTVIVPTESGGAFPSDPSATGVADGRLKLLLRPGEGWRFEAHQTVTTLTSGAASAGLGPNTGVGLQAPELVDLSWVAEDRDMTLRGRVDRVYLRRDQGPVSVTVGRQAVSFGAGMAFTPLDLVNPFNPTFIDQEYKPGVDAVRADLYHGTSFLTLVGAYAGDWDVDGLVAVAYGQSTLGVTDLGAFGGLVRGDAVAGASVVTSVRAVGLHSDVAITVPAGGERVFVRAVGGALARPAENTTLTAELYLQTLGARDPDGYLELASSPRFGIGELWLMGRTYLGISASQQLRPTVATSGALLSNLEDGSAFVAPSLAWSVATNVELVAGGFLGLGERPAGTRAVDVPTPGGGAVPVAFPVLRSEFGTYPSAAFLQMKVYF